MYALSVCEKNKKSGSTDQYEGLKISTTNKMTDKITDSFSCRLFYTVPHFSTRGSAVHRDQGAQLLGFDVEPRVVEEDDADGAGH